VQEIIFLLWSSFLLWPCAWDCAIQSSKIWQQPKSQIHSDQLITRRTQDNKVIPTSSRNCNFNVVYDPSWLCLVKGLELALLLFITISQKKKNRHQNILTFSLFISYHSLFFYYLLGHESTLTGPIVHQPKLKPRNVLGPEPLRPSLGSEMERSETKDSNSRPLNPRPPGPPTPRPPDSRS
jgi:hypothetical protein